MDIRALQGTELFRRAAAASRFDLLKTVQQFVAGYEVEACPLKPLGNCDS